MNKFKGDNNKWLTKSLILEHSYDDTSRVLYTLKEEDTEIDGRVIPSLRRLFVESDDPTCYKFAKEHLGGWSHFQALEAYVLRGVLDEWKEEMDIRLKSKAIVELKKLADSGDRLSNQFLAKHEYKTKRAAGAPSKAEKEGHLARESGKIASLAKHLDRISK